MPLGRFAHHGTSGWIMSCYRLSRSSNVEVDVPLRNYSLTHLL